MPDDFIPKGDEAPEAQDAFEALETSPANENLIVVEREPPPFGRSWAFDFSIPGFATEAGQGPLETRGIDTLRQWVIKCLLTARGAHPIHPRGYGMEKPFDVIGQPLSAFLNAELEERVANALTFHPRITGIEDFATFTEEEDDALLVEFRVMLDNEEELDIQGLRLT
jgi:phage baseplate assembly protein W